MRERDDNGAETPQPLDSRGRFIIDQAHAVPQDIAAFVLHQQGAFADGEGGGGPDADQTRLMLPELVAIAVLLHLGERCPLLSIVSYILAFITADWTRLWLPLARRKLCSARLTNPLFHVKNCI